jgi:hypothetical protein
VTARRLKQAVPAHLAVVVGVDVDEARCHHMPCRVDGFGGLAGHLRVVGTAPDNVDDLAILDADVSLVALRAGAVDDSATNDLQVEHEGLSLSPWAVDARRATRRARGRRGGASRLGQSLRYAK